MLGSEALRHELGALGLARSREFSWRKTAEKTLDFYEKIYNDSLNAL